MFHLFDSTKNIIAISNYKFNKETENIASKYDIIIRFNVGANQKILKQYTEYNSRTDLCCLSGYKTENFGPLDGFNSQHILFSRPKCQDNLQHFFKLICVKQEFEDSIKNNVGSINYIAPEIFNEFVHTYKYDHPTTGLMILYYIKKYLPHYQLDCMNFYVDNNLLNTFTHSVNSYHKLNIERNILQNLGIHNIITN